MIAAVLCLGALAFLISLPATVGARSLGRRLNALDTPGVAGQVKAESRGVPNTGGVAIFLGFAIPMLGALAAVRFGLAEGFSSVIPQLEAHLPGLREQSGAALWLLAGVTVLHIVGVADDRRPLGPWSKLAVMLGVSAGVVLLTDTRLLELLDGRFAGGYWLSVVLTVFWLVLITNAFNFLDNMDGLSAGTACVCGVFFLIAGLITGQWFVAATLALLVGATLGFLVFNFPWRTQAQAARTGKPAGASIFMGDGGSLVIGFLLAFLTVRTTYLPETASAGERFGSAWYAVFMPLVVLAVPLYDFVSVTLIRLSQGRSPFVGDLQHFSHRLVARGLSKRSAVVVIYGLTAVTSIGGVSLGTLRPWQAVLVGAQTLLVLGVLAIWEFGSVRELRRQETVA